MEILFCLDFFVNYHTSIPNQKVMKAITQPRYLPFTVPAIQNNTVALKIYS